MRMTAAVMYQQGLPRNLGGLAAVVAQAARQALGRDQNYAGCNIDRLYAHVAQARQGGRCIVGVQGG